MELITVKVKGNFGILPDLFMELTEGAVVQIPADRMSDELFELVPDPAAETTTTKTKSK